MTDKKFDNAELPGLYKTSNQASIDAQKIYYLSLGGYLILLIIAAFLSYYNPSNSISAIISAILFFITLGILIFIRWKRPDDIWYNGRAVAESVKTISWRWMMRAEPYKDCEKSEIVLKSFLNDLKFILNDNKNLSQVLQSGDAINDPISQRMKEIRALAVSERLKIYVRDRIENQKNWYWLKSKYNQRRAKLWFWISVVLHITAIIMLLCRINDPTLSLPIEVVATAAGAVMTWLQSKKHNELNSAYALAAHEISLIKGESPSVETEEQLSEYIISSESAFSREHTQWVARKNN
jgi:disulfide bond formation protein DsbB